MRNADVRTSPWPNEFFVVCASCGFRLGQIMLTSTYGGQIAIQFDIDLTYTHQHNKRRGGYWEIPASANRDMLHG
ncbi:MAG: hypothetical protein NTZ05_05345, partial [Chloroflexi bacterium]|nr:hypothetical protein [Chloroflexota bacterium]